MVYAAILAGGTGSRFGSEVPKQYLEVGGKPILIWSVKAFLALENVHLVLVVVPPAWVSYTEGLLAKEFPEDEIPVLEGGDTRNDSLMNAFDWIIEHNGLTSQDKILTHDAARPFVSRRIIESHIAALSAWDACDTCVPVSDTIVVSEDGDMVEEIPDRNRLYASQTPQSFRALKLWDLCKTLTPLERESLTDACKIFRLRNEPVKIIPGDRENIKITWPGDLPLAETILEGRTEE